MEALSKKQMLQAIWLNTKKQGRFEQTMLIVGLSCLLMTSVAMVRNIYQGVDSFFPSPTKIFNESEVYHHRGGTVGTPRGE
ncbi:MAG: hypothetical protein Q8Q90_03340 [bacterium]|nr:hypothetical protein [bacterium]